MMSFPVEVLFVQEATAANGGENVEDDLTVKLARG